MTSVKEIMVEMTTLDPLWPQDNSATTLENLPNSLLKGNFIGIDCHSTSTNPEGQSLGQSMVSS